MEKQIKKACDDHAEKCRRENINPIMEELKKVSENVTDIKIKFAALPGKIDKSLQHKIGEMKKECDEDYANKQTEIDVNAIKSGINKILWAVGIVILLAVLNLVMKQ